MTSFSRGGRFRDRVPASLLQIIELAPFATGMGDVLDDVAQMKAEFPRLNRVDYFDISERVVRGMLDRVMDVMVSPDQYGIVGSRHRYAASASVR